MRRKIISKGICERVWAVTALLGYILFYWLYYQAGKSEKKCIFSTNKLLNFANADISALVETALHL